MTEAQHAAQHAAQHFTHHEPGAADMVLQANQTGAVLSDGKHAVDGSAAEGVTHESPGSIAANEQVATDVITGGPICIDTC